MRLDRLAMTPLADAQSGGVEIHGLTADSRHVQPGYLFAALSGAQSDGRAFIPQAVENGAAAILTEKGDALTADSVPVIASANPRRDLALMAARFFELQPPHIAGVTGTNGKTSVATFLRQILSACGLKAASMGTLGVEADGYYESLHHTTPDPVRMHAALRDLAAHQITHLAMEASSHGLAQYRLDGVRVSAAGFTNLSRDHLDYHADFDNYQAAKARLFTELLATDGTAVIAMGHAAGDEMAEACAQAGRQVLPVGRPQDDVHVAIAARQTSGVDVDITLQGETRHISLPLIGDFQTENLAVALGLALAMGCETAQLFDAVAFCAAPRGRMQFIGRNKAGAAAYVDYAHTPDALANALDALRAHVPTHLPKDGRLLVMFGCGGDRDTGKRPEMGRVAADKADGVIVTDDNPRHEDAAAIRAEILAACPGAQEVADRKAAIEQILAMAEENDLVLLAGKGHESGQIIGDTILPFDDIKIAQAALHMPHLSDEGGRHG
jgi:UDP-N-acetylmuramoyl-L-alanyl-D-glutamate--2,6-diaminopimelate ligase